MKKKLYIISALCCSLFLAAPAVGQYKTFVKFNPFTLPNEFDVYLSRDVSPSLTLVAGGGFVYTDYWDNILNQFDFGQFIPDIDEHQYLNAKGYAARFGMRFYIIPPYEKRKIAGTYFEPLLLFKQIWYPYKEKKLDSRNFRERSVKYVSGLQLLIGRQHKWHSLYLDKYLGLGVKAKTYHFDDFQFNSSDQIENRGKRTTTWLPDIELGIKIAFDLSKK